MLYMGKCHRINCSSWSHNKTLPKFNSPFPQHLIRQVLLTANDLKNTSCGNLNNNLTPNQCCIFLSFVSVCVWSSILVISSLFPASSQSLSSSHCGHSFKWRHYNNIMWLTILDCPFPKKMSCRPLSIFCRNQAPCVHVCSFQAHPLLTLISIRRSNECCSCDIQITGKRVTISSCQFIQTVNQSDTKWTVRSFSNALLNSFRRFKIWKPPWPVSVCRLYLFTIIDALAACYQCNMCVCFYNWISFSMTVAIGHAIHIIVWIVYIHIKSYMRRPVLQPGPAYPVSHSTHGNKELKRFVVHPRRELL